MIEKTLFSHLLKAGNGVELRSPDADLDQAIAALATGMANKLSVNGDEKLAQKASNEDSLKGLGSSVDDSPKDHPEKSKSEEIPGFDAICQLLASGG